jgi:Mg2+/Co2+ transporter CorB
MGAGESAPLVYSLLLVVGSILVVAFFSSSEASLIAVNRIRVRHKAEAGIQGSSGGDPGGGQA